MQKWQLRLSANKTASQILSQGGITQIECKKKKNNDAADLIIDKIMTVLVCLIRWFWKRGRRRSVYDCWKTPILCRCPLVTTPAMTQRRRLPRRDCLTRAITPRKVRCMAALFSTFHIIRLVQNFKKQKRDTDCQRICRRTDVIYCVTFVLTHSRRVFVSPVTPVWADANINKRQLPYST